VIGAKDEQIAALTASLEAALARLEVAAAEAVAARERERRRQLRQADDTELTTGDTVRLAGTGLRIEPW
jgi:septal ring factor EnvC (AmiA/AmiB activator)